MAIFSFYLTKKPLLLHVTRAFVFCLVFIKLTIFDRARDSALARYFFMTFTGFTFGRTITFMSWSWRTRLYGKAQRKAKQGNEAIFYNSLKIHKALISSYCYPRLIYDVVLTIGFAFCVFWASKGDGRGKGGTILTRWVVQWLKWVCIRYFFSFF